VLDILVQKHRDKRAVKRFFCNLFKGLRYAPRRIVTDKLRSYSAARKEVMPDVIHGSDKWQNNRAGNSLNPHDNARCGDLNHRGKRNAFSQPTVRSIIFFALDVTT
jgi:transposase-like protein